MAGNRVINDPAQVVEDLLAGWLAAHGDSIRVHPGHARVLQRRDAPVRGKVGLVTGGGAGHEPAFLGYLGPGLCDAVAVGEVFSSPTAKAFREAMRAADGGAGVLCLYGNYAGDNMNVAMAVQMAEREGQQVRTVVATDDVPSAPRGEEALRRGVAGEILMWKVAGAKAESGASLDEVEAVARKAIANTRSMGIGLSACTIPAVGKANFHIEPGTMEVGIGHHGEPGMAVQPTVSAAEMATQMLDTLLPDLPLLSGDRVAVLLSGLGGTPVMEPYILYGEVAAQLARRGLEVAFCRVGGLFTSLDMRGVTLTLMKLDDELLQGLLAPCASVALAVAGPGAVAPTPAGMGGMGGMAPSPPSLGPGVDLAQAGSLVRELVAVIVLHREPLSEIDGQIGDGDHGINMAKGFLACQSRLDGLGARAESLPLALEQLSQALMDDIGGSMGPLYGSFFLAWAEVLAPHAWLDAALFGAALDEAVARVQALGRARVGDKTLMDTLVPAREAYARAQAEGLGFVPALQAMAAAAQAGRDSTRALQARVGRAARLGARSVGVLDAGATSCCLILQGLADGVQRRLEG